MYSVEAIRVLTVRMEVSKQSFSNRTQNNNQLCREKQRTLSYCYSNWDRHLEVRPCLLILGPSTHVINVNQAVMKI